MLVISKKRLKSINQSFKNQTDGKVKFIVVLEFQLSQNKLNNNFPIFPEKTTKSVIKKLTDKKLKLIMVLEFQLSQNTHDNNILIFLELSTTRNKIIT